MARLRRASPAVTARPASPHDAALSHGRSFVKVNLVVFTADGARRQIPVGHGTYVIGRDRDAQIRVPLPSVSRHHCELSVTEEQVRVRDLDSSNGTYRNYGRIEEATLEPGDILGVGECLLTLQIDGVPADVQRPEPPIDDAIGAGPTSAPAATPPADGSSMMDAAPPPPPSTPLAEEDSSLFDFDFDLDDDENPKL